MANAILNDIVPLHKEVARRIKQYESELNEAPPVDVINELRYALRAVLEIETLQADKTPNQADIDHAVERAKHALLCAYHDLVDGVAIDIGNALTKLADSYQDATIQVIGEKRIEILDYLDEVNAVITQSRENIESRNELYENELYQKRFDQLLKYRRYLVRSAYPEIVKANQAIRKRNHIHKLQFISAIAVTIIVGISGALLL